ncbi:MAG TPA: GGDEF domain-containing protein [Methylophaga sp.]|nr:GGDEF domain-containing protein [Methylophaga sp.]
MQKILQSIFPFVLPQSFSDKSTANSYKEWGKPARQIQICAITFLTALLYIILDFLNKSWAPEHAQILMTEIYLFAVIPLLLAVSFLAYKKRFYPIVMPAVCVLPIFTMLCHVYIARQLSDYSPFVTEGYLAVIWIFIVSGMTFTYALISASICSIILIVSGFHLIPDPGVYTMHVFWIFCSFSFGFLAGLIFDKSRKTIFLNQQALHKQAITDELTGLFNRNHLNMVLSQEIARERRYGKRFGLLVIDIDHFKKINDTFGHTTGDDVLSMVAKVLAESIRRNDTLVRWGGEEFVLIAINVDDKTLFDLAEKLRYQIEKNTYGFVDKVTISIGATLFRTDDTKDDLLSRADQALYEAKGQGRNRTIAL